MTRFKKSTLLPLFAGATLGLASCHDRPAAAAPAAAANTATPVAVDANLKSRISALTNTICQDDSRPDFCPVEEYTRHRQLVKEHLMKQAVLDPDFGIKLSVLEMHNASVDIIPRSRIHDDFLEENGFRGTSNPQKSYFISTSPEWLTRPEFSLVDVALERLKPQIYQRFIDITSELIERYDSPVELKRDLDAYDILTKLSPPKQYALPDPAPHKKALMLYTAFMLWSETEKKPEKDKAEVFQSIQNNPRYQEVLLNYLTQKNPGSAAAAPSP